MSLGKQCFSRDAGPSQSEHDRCVRAAEPPIAPADSPVAEPSIESGYRQLLRTGACIHAGCIESPTLLTQLGMSELGVEKLVERVVELTIARINSASAKPFINSRECADLIGVTPEHLCAMRARGEGPPWSGQGKWIRYQTRAVLEWLSNLPREAPSLPATSELEPSRGQ